MRQFNIGDVVGYDGKSLIIPKNELGIVKRFGDDEPFYHVQFPQLGESVFSDVEVHFFEGLLVDFVKKVRANAVIKGIRNTQDMEYEKTQQYWNEDLGMDCPTFYIISDRKLVHISSSAIRALEKFKGVKND